MRLRTATVTAMIVSVLALGIGASVIVSGDDASESSEVGTGELEALVAHRTAAGASAGLVGPRSLADALPNVTYRSTPVSTSVVLARVTDVANGEGMFREDLSNPAELEHAVAFDDPRAQYRTLLVTLAVDELVAGTAPGESVTLRWLIAGPNLPEGSEPTPEDPDDVAAGLRQLGRSLWLVPDGGFLADYGYRYVATVDEQDQVDFVFYEAEQRDSWAGPLTTVAKIRDEGRRPERTVNE